MAKLFEIPGVEIHDTEGGGRDLCVFIGDQISHVHHLTEDQRDTLVEALLPSDEDEAAAEAATTTKRKGKSKSE